MKNNTHTVTRQSMMTGKTNSMVLPISEREFFFCSVNHKKGMLIQDAFPMLNADEREFVKTGITPEEWDYLHGDAPYPHSEVSPHF